MLHWPNIILCSYILIRFTEWSCSLRLHDFTVEHEIIFRFSWCNSLQDVMQPQDVWIRSVIVQIATNELANRLRWGLWNIAAFMCEILKHFDTNRPWNTKKHPKTVLFEGGFFRLKTAGNQLCFTLHVTMIGKPNNSPAHHLLSTKLDLQISWFSCRSDGWSRWFTNIRLAGGHFPACSGGTLNTFCW